MGSDSARDTRPPAGQRSRFSPVGPTRGAGSRAIIQPEIEWRTEPYPT